MRVCDLNTGITVLQRAAKKLREKWVLTQDRWKDKASREFQEQHLRPLVPQLNLTVAAVQRLAEVVERAERECEDRGDEL